MTPIYYLIIELIELYKYALIIYIVGVWLTQFNIFNGSNRFVYIIMSSLHKLCDPSMRIIKKFIPNFGAIDISPIIVFLFLTLIQRLIKTNLIF